MIRVLIVSERALVRAGLRRMLESTPGVEIAGDVADVVSAKSAMARTSPSVVLVDFALPATVALEATADLCRAAGTARVVVLGGYEDHEHAVRTAEAGAAGFLWKGADVAELEAALRTVDAGARYISPQVAGAAPTPGSGPVVSLSKREFEVMCFLASGMTNREIAEQLGISVKTIDTHRGHVLKKLQLRNNSDITRFAIRHGFVRL